MRGSSGRGFRGNRRLPLWTVLVAGLLLASLANVGAAEFRTWNDRSGQFKITARLSSESNGKVTLVQENGEELEIELSQLSVADQRYVTNQRTVANPFKKAGPRDPFKRKGAGGGNSPAMQDASGAHAVAPDWSGVKSIRRPIQPRDWKFDIPPAAANALSSVASKPIRLPASTHIFETARSLVTSAQSRRAVIGYLNDQGKEAGMCRLVLCDLEGGKFLGTASIGGLATPMALDDSGTRVLMRRAEFGFGKHDSLELWTMGESGITKGIQWFPYDDQKDKKRDVLWAEFLDAKRLATVSDGGLLVIWEYETAKPLYRLEIQGDCKPALSPDRKRMVFLANQNLEVLDLAEMKVVASQRVPEPIQRLTLKFTPRGTRLVGARRERLIVWNFADGSFYRDISLSGLSIDHSLLCASEDTVLAGGHVLVDLESQVKAWRLDGFDHFQAMEGTCYFLVLQRNSPNNALVPLTLPGPTIRAALDEALADPGFFILKPGVTVNINVDGLADPSVREGIRSALSAKLKQLGGKTGPNGTIELVALTETGPEREVAYHQFGRLFSKEVHKVHESFSRLRFVFQGTVVWEVSVTSMPAMMSLKQGQTIEQALREHEAPNYEFFENTELPRLLTRPTNGQRTLGASDVTISGLVPHQELPAQANPPVRAPVGSPAPRPTPPQQKPVPF